MFNSPKRQCTGLSTTPKSEARSRRDLTGKDKMVAFIDGPALPPPPTGLLDEAALERRDLDALQERAQRLENEKKWILKNEELQESLLEAQEVLKREKSSNLLSISQVDEREANPRKALDVERQSHAEPERSLHESSSEHDNTNANNLVAGVHDRSLEVKQKLVTADARLAESNRKSLELERKLQEVDARENAPKRKSLTFTERDACEVSFLMYKQDLLEWERKLEEGEERLCQSRRHFYDIEKVNEFNRTFKEKEKLEEELNRAELENVALKNKEDDDIDRRLAELENVALKNKEDGDIDRRLAELIGKEVEIQILLDGHRSTLNLKSQEFESELEEKRKLFEEGNKAELDTLDDDRSKLEFLLEFMEETETVYDTYKRLNEDDLTSIAQLIVDDISSSWLPCDYKDDDLEVLYKGLLLTKKEVEGYYRNVLARV